MWTLVRLSFTFLVMIVPAVEAVGLYAPLGDLDAVSLILIGVGIGCGAVSLALATRWTARGWLAKAAWEILWLISGLDSVFLLLRWAGRD